MSFINKSGLEFGNISSEMYREYDFGDKVIRIDNPTQLNISESGGHRIFDESETSHYIPTGWIHLQWKAKKDSPNFVK